MPVGKHDRTLFHLLNTPLPCKKRRDICLNRWYADQFGGSKGKKFMYKQLKELLISVSHLSMEEQKSPLPIPSISGKEI